MRRLGGLYVARPYQRDPLCRTDRHDIDRDEPV